MDIEWDSPADQVGTLHLLSDLADDSLGGRVAAAMARAVKADLVTKLGNAPRHPAG